MRRREYRGCDHYVFKIFDERFLIPKFSFFIMDGVFIFLMVKPLSVMLCSLIIYLSIYYLGEVESFKILPACCFHYELVAKLVKVKILIK